MTRARRIVVAQADARARAGLREPLSVGVVRWRGADPRLALVAKLTLRFDRDAIRVVEPEPVRHALAGSVDTSGEGTLEYPSDFVFFKPRCDLSIVGHAHVAPPAERIDVEARIGSWHAAYRALASRPEASIPLTAAHLRDARDEPVSLSPRAVAREPEGAASDHYDHAVSQSAPEAMQIDPPSPDAPVELVRLSPRKERRTFALPNLVPLAWADGIRGLVALPLRCDTVHLDTDFERLVLVWRAPLPEGMVDVDRFVVSLEDASDAPRDLEAIQRDLPRGSVGWAIEETALEGDDADLEMASYEVLEHRAEPEMTLERFAAVSARLAEQDRPRADILDELSLSDRAWTIEERAWIEIMGDRAMAGDGTLPVEFAELFLAAQDRLAGPDEPRPIETYAALKAALERADKPKDLLDERGVSFGEWMRLERHYNDRAAQDPALAARLAELIAAARGA